MTLQDRFRQHELGMLSRGSGLTEDQRTGASLAFMWLESHQWNVAEGNAPTPHGDCRKLVWLMDRDGMGWVGIRAYNHAEQCWWINAVNGGRPESAMVTHWMDLPEPPKTPPGRIHTAEEGAAREGL